MLIAWTPLSSRVINGVQGRYFLPFLPVLLLALKNDWVVLDVYKRQGVGQFGDASMFSFHATKVFHSIEGGAVVFQDEALKDCLLYTSRDRLPEGELLHQSPNVRPRRSNIYSRQCTASLLLDRNP